jgi:hypothetical protein
VDDYGQLIIVIFWVVVVVGGALIKILLKLFGTAESAKGAGEVVKRGKQIFDALADGNLDDLFKSKEQKAAETKPEQPTVEERPIALERQTGDRPTAPHEPQMLEGARRLLEETLRRSREQRSAESLGRGQPRVRPASEPQPEGPSAHKPGELRRPKPIRKPEPIRQPEPARRPDLVPQPESARRPEPQRPTAAPGPRPPHRPIAETAVASAAAVESRSPKPSGLAPPEVPRTPRGEPKRAEPMQIMPLETPALPVLGRLRTRGADALRDAIILREILGPPLALQRRRSRGMSR